MDAEDIRPMDLGRPWSEDLRAQWDAGGFGGLIVNVPARVAARMSLEFLRDLPGLRWLDLSGRFRYDDVAFEVPALEALTLWTASSSPLQVGKLERLRSLSVKGQRSIDSIREAEKLEYLYVQVDGCVALDFLGSKPNLTAFLWERSKLDGPLASLVGIGAAPRLQTIELYDFEVADLGALSGVNDLVELEIVGPLGKSETSEGVIDLEPLVGLQSLKSVAIVGMSRPLASVEPLLRMPSLAHLRLGDCVVADGDLSPLLQLPRQIDVGPPKNHPNHSHKARDIEAARLAMKQ